MFEGKTPTITTCWSPLPKAENEDNDERQDQHEQEPQGSGSQQDCSQPAVRFANLSHRYPLFKPKSGRLETRHHLGTDRIRQCMCRTKFEAIQQILSRMQDRITG